MRALAVLVLLVLTGCGGPYDFALESPHLERPQPPLTAADRRALEPYDNSPYF